MHIASDEEIKGWSLRLALVVLGAATVVTALVAEILVASIDTFAEDSGLSEFFLAAVVIAIVGNAAEHGGAVVVAARGKIKLATEIALASSAQVAVFLIPAVDAARAPDRAARALDAPGGDRRAAVSVDRRRRPCSRTGAPAG